MENGDRLLTCLEYTLFLLRNAQAILHRGASLDLAHNSVRFSTHFSWKALQNVTGNRI